MPRQDQFGENINLKKFVKKLIITLAFGLVLLHPPASSQSVVYDILLAGRSVGELTITPPRSGDGADHFRVRGAIDTFLYDVVYVSENRFENGVLKTSMSSQEVNGKLKEKTNTVQTTGNYRVTFAEGNSAATETTQIPHPINYTVTSLYYREPLNMKQIYSDRYGKMCSVQKVATGAYEVMMPDGKKTLYHYSQGQCREVKSQIAGLNLIFRIRPDSVAR
ncbi:hypothetical protein GCM10007390_22160 [Persicitalea jodogahamensis]|uniref:Uncharacterized protein n=1 Tax=Persicitalea jodogahamensis TaxID=402147 RepID=A0A8J3D8H0_9BACT|nr:hypothetical protein GCM10007390_22160 [Persicitalea jodogahamensis]